MFPRTPLHYAAASRHYQCLETLVACGTAINATDQWGRSALHYAAASDLDRRWGAAKYVWQPCLQLILSSVVSKLKEEFLLVAFWLCWGEEVALRWCCSSSHHSSGVCAENLGSCLLLLHIETWWSTPLCFRGNQRWYQGDDNAWPPGLAAPQFRTQMMHSQASSSYQLTS